jgi:fatty acid desaturase
MAIATRLPGERSLDRCDADRIAMIREQIIDAGDRWRARHPLLARNQDAIGLILFLGSVLLVGLDAALYATGVLPWWLCIPLTALWLSILHEIEHDLIHRMYFRTRPLPHHAMMLVVWFLRPSTINPWIRRRLHLHHHSVSGTDSDLEERAITNGERWGGHRLLSLMDSMLGLYLGPFRMRALVRAYVRHEARDREEARRLVKMNRLAYFPLGTLHYLLWHLFIGLHAFQLLGGHLAPSGAWRGAYDALNFLAVVLLAPNALRTFCLHFVSSNMHYYGDIEAHNVLKQTQVWTSRWLWPVHAFCFNFGGTHAIHHFLVRDPFYLREAIASECQQILRQNGVRFNDFGTFKRANRWSIPATTEP